MVQEAWWKEPKEYMVAAIEREEVTWKEELGARDENVKERRMEVYKEGKRKVKRCLYKSKMKVNEQLKEKE